MDCLPGSISSKCANTQTVLNHAACQHAIKFININNETKNDQYANVMHL